MLKSQTFPYFKNIYCIFSNAFEILKNVVSEFFFELGESREKNNVFLNKIPFFVFKLFNR